MWREIYKLEAVLRQKNNIQNVKMLFSVDKVKMDYFRIVESVTSF